ncbi:hypothetical protein F5884DRAFT_391476 [Xylogone sp. PMI_703]|nr:hypothetical protein F5884DRAFT_391476 [Xylogone sp. PMI_703]
MAFGTAQLKCVSLEMKGSLGKQEPTSPLASTVSHIWLQIHSLILDPLAQVLLQMAALLGLRQMVESYKPRPRHLLIVAGLALIGLFLLTSVSQRADIIQPQDVQPPKAPVATSRPPSSPPPAPAPPPTTNQTPKEIWLTLNRILRPSKFPVGQPKKSS